MCDTFAAAPDSTRHGETVFAKNSDREPNEAQNLTYVPGTTHTPGSKVRCTLIEIPQVKKTYSVILSRPFWMWGAEMGFNENSVAIGNEAVFTKEPYEKKGLLGMDLLRLALERSTTAKDALEIITDLLEKYGQGGNGGYQKTLLYHNSFLIADPNEVFILETAGRHWVAKEVNSTASISNALTIQDDYSMNSPGLVEHAQKKGYTPADQKLNFSSAFSDKLFTHFAAAKLRQSCSSDFLSQKNGSIDSYSMMELLRDHNTPGLYKPGTSPMKRICLHAGGLISTQSTASMIALLRPGLPPLAYFTGTSGTCLGIFKPVILEKGQLKGAENYFMKQMQDGSIEIYGRAEEKFDPETLWWHGELIHRRAIMNYPALAPAWIKERDNLEKEYLSKIEIAWRKGNTKEASRQSSECSEKFIERTKEISDEMAGLMKLNSTSSPLWFRLYWKNINRKAGFPLSI